MNAAGSGDSGGIGQKSPAPPSQSRPLVYAANSCEIVVVGGNKENDNYGAWPVCTNLLPPNPLVYSFGIGGDISFDVAMVSDFHARAVFCYDPTIDEESFATLSNAKDANLSFSQIGLGASNKVIHFYKSRNPKIGSMVSTPGLKGYHTDPFLTAPVHDIATLAAINGHTWIDLIKLDVEGGEFEVFLQSDISSLPTSLNFTRAFSMKARPDNPLCTNSLQRRDGNWPMSSPNGRKKRFLSEQTYLTI